MMAKTTKEDQGCKRNPQFFFLQQAFINKGCYLGSRVGEAALGNWIVFQLQDFTQGDSVTDQQIQQNARRYNIST